ncbi:MAG: redoxin domain-containing protein [Flavobacteriales bacterium]|nr:redoxin domain-containing protein [Flavobacteriales bacterium]
MKKAISFVFAVIASASLMSFGSADSGNQLSIGDNMPMAHIKMAGVDGNEVNLREAMKPNGLLVIFTCNTCPFVLEWEETYNDLYEVASGNNMGMILVNSNEAKRTGDDSMEEMIAHAKAQNYAAPYVIDENHVVADAFGANTTPHVYLFDKNLSLIYTGCIDDRYENSEKAVTKTYLVDAMNAYSDKAAIDPAVTKNKGCSIKRVKK